MELEFVFKIVLLVGVHKAVFEWLQSFTEYLRLTLVFMYSSLREKLISVFQEFFASITKIFILAGGLGTRLSFYGV